MDYKVVLSPSARADIRDIVRYISWDAPDRALAFGKGRTAALKQLHNDFLPGLNFPDFTV